ncbi:GNAT domain-containing protein [Mycena amicta]|nr:GNAT domain-containing protein [Mycena amicta]
MSAKLGCDLTTMSFQLHPLEVNPSTGEPFLRLLEHRNIIVTPARRTDGPAMMQYQNDERVYPWLISPPYPYTLEDANWWLDRVIPASEKLLAELEDAKDAPKLLIVDGCPVNYLREIQDDGTELFIGAIDFTLSRHPFELEGSGRTPADVGDKPLRDPQNPDIWTVGNYLAPSHHGRGIMSDAFKTVLTMWAVPRMGVRKMVVNALEGNIGSVKVFEKNGFRLREKSADAMVNARGVMKPVHVLDWVLNA